VHNTQTTSNLCWYTSRVALTNIPRIACSSNRTVPQPHWQAHRCMRFVNHIHTASWSGSLSICERLQSRASHLVLCTVCFQEDRQWHREQQGRFLPTDWTTPQLAFGKRASNMRDRQRVYVCCCKPCMHMPYLHAQQQQQQRRQHNHGPDRPRMCCCPSRKGCLFVSQSARWWTGLPALPLHPFDALLCHCRYKRTTKRKTHEHRDTAHAIK
jgi:hypothetical protein